MFFHILSIYFDIVDHKYSGYNHVCQLQIDQKFMQITLFIALTIAGLRKDKLIITGIDMIKLILFLGIVV